MNDWAERLLAMQRELFPNHRPYRLALDRSDVVWELISYPYWNGTDARDARPSTSQASWRILARVPGDPTKLVDADPNLLRPIHSAGVDDDGKEVERDISEIDGYVICWTTDDRVAEIPSYYTAKTSKILDAGALKRNEGGPK